MNEFTAIFGDQIDSRLNMKTVIIIIIIIISFMQWIYT